MACSTLDNRDVCRIAAAADVDHRTVCSFLAGTAGARSSRARARIEDAMKRLGFDEHIPRYPGLVKA